MSDAREADRVLAQLAHGCTPPEPHEVRPAYQPVEVYGAAGSTLHGVIIAWTGGTNGPDRCRLRLQHAGDPKWVTFDPETIVMLVQGGT
jgi:hypothetical protein